MRIVQRSLCLLVIAYLVGVASARCQSTDDVIKVDTNLVNIPVAVSDRDNRRIAGLYKESFKIFQDGTEQEIAVFDNTEAPMTVVLALDTSRSTQGVMGKIKKAAKKFLKDLDANDRCMIMSFDNDIEKLSELTSDKKELQRAIGRAEIGSNFGTLLNDAVYAAIYRELKGVKGRKAVILLTDGADAGSGISRNALIEKLAESDTVVYPIFYHTELFIARQLVRGGRFPNGRMGRGRGDRRFPGGNFPFPGGRGPQNGGNFPRRGSIPNPDELNRASIAYLERLAEVTGGRFYKEDKADLDDAFQAIADELKRQYLIGFYPTGENVDGTLHKVKVTVDLPNVAVRSKSTYRTQTK